ncbi:MAG: glycosyltransferase family 39 protein [Candidatus Aminicenantes bacterium]|nr:glycosyltransferase family 39 protein [Candidatus Aminicenantes bacterium]
MTRIKIPWQVIALGIISFLACSLFSYFVLDAIPHVHDEVAYQFQSKIFLQGKLFVKSPCVPEAFNYPHIINNGKWYSQYPPGYPLLLMPFVLVGLPWLLNPFFAFLSIIVFYFLGCELYNRKIGLLTALFGTLSIWFLLMSSTMMAHTSCVFFISTFLLGLWRLIQGPSVAHALIAGFGWGAAFLIRPYSTVLISLPFFLYYFIRLVRNFKMEIKFALVLGTVLVLSVSTLMGYNYLTNGDPFRLGYIELYGPQHELGFGRTGYTSTAHSPLLGFQNVYNNLSILNKTFMGWPLSSFWLLIPLFWSWKSTSLERKKDYILLLAFTFLLVGYFIYWAFHVFLGARLLFEGIPILLLLTAKGAYVLPQLLGRISFIKMHIVKPLLVILLILFTSYSFFIRFPDWIRPKYSEWFTDIIDSNLQGVTANINRSIRQLEIENAVVIMKLIYHPLQIFENHWSGSGFINNGPFLKESVVFAADRGEENIKIFECFPGRSFYMYVGTLEKGMVIPVERYESEMRYKDPLVLFFSGKKGVELISDPIDFFFLYSVDFKKFLNDFFLKVGNRLFNVSQFMNAGQNFENHGDYKNAVFCYEAVLQIEKQPKVRFQILNKLIFCYFKTRQTEFAKKILLKMSGSGGRGFYSVLPERGF